MWSPLLARGPHWPLTPPFHVPRTEPVGAELGYFQLCSHSNFRIVASSYGFVQQV